MAISFRPDPPITLGLLGGVASGKSTVAEFFEAHGLVRLDADAVAREVVDDPQILDQIRARFGKSVFERDDRLDRRALGSQVFADRAKLRDLEAITHPAIRVELNRQLEAAHAAGDSVVLDIPLLIEGGWLDRCDVCVFVDANEAARRNRAAQRGWAADELQRRERNQADFDAKRAASRYNVDTSGSMQQTRRDVSRVIENLRSATPRTRD